MSAAAAATVGPTAVEAASSPVFFTTQEDLDRAPDPGTLRCRRVAAITADTAPLDVLFEHASGILVLNKPADVRMGGAFALTLEKQLKERFPHRKLHPSHQLDFATSGVLAYTDEDSKASAVVHTLFENRKTKKQYLAVLDGHLTEAPLHIPGVKSLEEILRPHFPGGPDDAAALESAIKDLSLDRIHDQLEKKVATKFLVKSDAVMPVRLGGMWHTVGLEVLVQVMKQRKEKKEKSSTAIPTSTSASKEEPFSRLLSLPKWKDFRTFAGEARTSLGDKAPPKAGVIGAMAAEFGSRSPPVIDAQAYFERAVLQMLEESDVGAPLDPLTLACRWFVVCQECEAIDTARYRVDQAKAGEEQEKAVKAAAQKAAEAFEQSRAGKAAAGGSGASHPLAAAELLALPKPRFLIDLPLADLAGDFKMAATGPGGKGRPSQTLVQVLTHGYWRQQGQEQQGQQGNEGEAAAAAPGSQPMLQPVTKVLFMPITGRRHQLRVHATSIGHVILGDATYASSAQEAEQEKPRMMLHAWRLQLLFPEQAKAAATTTAAAAPAPADALPVGKVTIATADPFLPSNGKAVEGCLSLASGDVPAEELVAPLV